MQIVSYPSKDLFPIATQAATTKLYQAADTGAVYSVKASSPIGYIPYWPDSPNPVYNQDGIIGSNRTLQDTVHVRT